MKKSVFCIILIISLNAGIYAQNHMFLGAGGGVFTNVPTDIDVRALASIVHSTYHKYMYTQYDYFGSFTPVASFIFGYGTKHFGIQFGFDALFDINENFEVLHPQTEKLTARVSYTYSMFNVPVVLHFFPLATSKFKLGLLVGGYFSIPYADIQKESTSPANFFDKSSTATTTITTSSTITQDFGGGLRFGLVTEFLAGKSAFVFELGYQRELFPSASSMNLQALLNDGTATVEFTERKITLLSGPRVGLSYKYRFMFKDSVQTSAKTGASAAAPVTAQPVLENGQYFMMIAGTYEGPIPVAELRALAGRGLLTPETMLWKKGLSDWAKAGTFSDLAPLFVPAP